MRLIAGLGNPGRRYERTRHNAGFMLVDRLAAISGGTFSEFSRSSRVCSTNLFGIKALFLKPQTFMNASGRAVEEVIRYFKLELPQLLIVYDEVSLPLGSFRIRPSGSSAGHKGMTSVIETLGTEQIARMRIGIRGPEAPEDLSAYVLEDFRRDELLLLEHTFEACCTALNTLFTEGIEKAMSRFNTRQSEPEGEL